MDAWSLLALDIATCTGWVEGDGSRLPDHGFLDLPPPRAEDRGPAFTTLRNFVRRRIDKAAERRVRLIVGFEQPLLPRPFLKNGRIVWNCNIETTLLLQGLVGVVEQLCDETDTECGHVDVGTVKKALAGFGGAEKEDMVFVARKVGLTIERHDTADAFGVWLAGIREFDKRRSEEWDRRIWSSRGGLL